MDSKGPCNLHDHRSRTGSPMMTKASGACLVYDKNRKGDEVAMEKQVPTQLTLSKQHKQAKSREEHDPRH